MLGEVVLAAEPVVDESLVTPGALGLVLIVLMGVALFFLVRSMRKQMDRINPDLPTDKVEPFAESFAEPDPAQPGSGGDLPDGDSGQTSPVAGQSETGEGTSPRQ